MLLSSPVYRHENPWAGVSVFPTLMLSYVGMLAKAHARPKRALHPLSSISTLTSLVSVAYHVP